VYVPDTSVVPELRRIKLHGAVVERLRSVDEVSLDWHHFALQPVSIGPTHKTPRRGLQFHGDARVFLSLGSVTCVLLLGESLYF
jgi:hypothetical protein